uniref:Uncharacterized protein n=1 Tax=Panagrolaimus sp. JU765 TaxID=591449 RepID=A0AC34Q5V3_9BILA
MKIIDPLVVSSSAVVIYKSSSYPGILPVSSDHIAAQIAAHQTPNQSCSSSFKSQGLAQISCVQRFLHAHRTIREMMEWLIGLV